MNHTWMAFAVALFVLVGCSGGDSSSTTQKKQTDLTAKPMDCCQCTKPGSGTTGSTPVACTTGVTSQSACDSTCRPNLGGIMNGNCKDGVRCM